MNKVMKSLYFKLNEENPKHQAIIRFFDKAKSLGMNKVDVLYYMVQMDEAARKVVHLHVKDQQQLEKLKNLVEESIIKD